MCYFLKTPKFGRSTKIREPATPLLAYTGNTDNTDNTDNWDVSQGEQEEQAKGGIKKRAADVLKERQVRRTAIKTIPPCNMSPRSRWASPRWWKTGPARAALAPLAVMAT